MTWRIPPVGWCAVCLLARDRTVAATTTFRGTALCTDHLRMTFGDELEVAVHEERLAADAEAENETPTEPVLRGSQGRCVHCGEAIVFAVFTVGEWGHQRHGDLWCHDSKNYTKTPLQRAEPDPEFTIIPPRGEGE